MMVGHPLPVGQLMSSLDQASQEIHNLSKPTHTASSGELKKLIGVLEDCNASLNPNILQDKNLAPAQMKASIEKALLAVAIFNSNRPENNAAAQRSVNQATAGLFSALRSEVEKLDKNLRDIRKHRIGRRVEKVNESKDTKDKR